MDVIRAEIAVRAPLPAGPGPFWFDLGRLGLRWGKALLAQTAPPAVLFQLLFGWLLLDLLLLCRFLGLTSQGLYSGLALASVTLLWLLHGRRAPYQEGGPTLATLLACFGIATVIMLLGGEGRVFYANLDWQVRDAVLHDMAANPWPFIYPTGDLLRAPIGMYLLPALAGKQWGQAGADLALLIQNSWLLGLVLALGSTLFANRRARAIALAVFLSFSGLDVVGQIKAGHSAGLSWTAHLEGWSVTQYSSTITLAFWVPQHALAGWIGALGFLLWRVGRVRPGALLSLPPLLALWSPLAAMGLMPFLIFALVRDWADRRIAPRDVALPLLAMLIAMPSLLYLSAAGDQVGARFFPIPPNLYLLFEVIEVLPYLLVAAAGWRGRFGGAPYLICSAALLLMPFVQVGWWIDFAMRASIPSLSILSIHLADGLAGGWSASPRRRAALLGLLAIGSLTGAAEISRSLAFPTSPPPRCSFPRAWDETFAAWPKSSYLAPLARLSAAIRPRSPAVVGAIDPVRCYDRPWMRPALF